MPEPGAGEGGGQASRRQWFEQELGRLMDRLYGTALRLTRNQHDAEDVVAEAVEKAWSKLDELQDPQCFEGWLFRILNNTFVTVWRRRRCRQELETGLEPAEPENAGREDFSLFQRLHQPFLLWWATPQDELLNSLLQEDIQAALDSLPDAYRVVIVLVEVQGYKYAEVARLLDVPLGTVRSRLNRARSLLQRALWEHARDAGLVTSPAPAAEKPRGERT